jgi:hypothetical protein
MPTLVIAPKKNNRVPQLQTTSNLIDDVFAGEIHPAWRRRPSIPGTSA